MQVFHIVPFGDWKTVAIIGCREMAEEFRSFCDYMDVEITLVQEVNPVVAREIARRRSDEQNDTLDEVMESFANWRNRNWRFI